VVRPLEIGEADIRFEDGIPFSEPHADIYYSRGNGLAESRYVFLEGNDLPARWRGPDRFTVGETGFGTGLNFLAAWQCWRETARRGATLHYLSAERYPLTRAQLEQALAGFPELAGLASELIRHYPPRIPGFHRLHLDEGRVQLTLLFGDAAEAFARLEGQIDAWFLDGFAPSRNESMWTADLFAALARHSAPGATLATFTAAGDVRRALQAEGFAVNKVKGFGGKREMITARIPAPPTRISSTPWFDPPQRLPAGDHAVVVGGGIAGCSMVHALAQRGIRCTLVEREQGIAQAASGNPAGLLMPKLTADQSLSSRYYTEAYRYTLDLLARLVAGGHAPRWSDCGVLQLGFHDKVRASHARVARRNLPEDFARVVEADEASRLAGADMPLGGLWFAQGGWIDPASFCQALLDAAGPSRVTVLRSTEALELEYEQTGWRVRKGSGEEIARARHVIVCTGADTAALLPDVGASLVTVRGQISRVPGTAESRLLKSVLCYKGYLTPAIDDEHIMGATYDRDDLSPALRVEDHRDNIEKLQRVLPSWFGDTAPGTIQGRVAYRSTTPDRLPLIGNVPEGERYRVTYGDLWKGRKAARYPSAPGMPGLWVSAGHSSRGLIGAPLAAEIIASAIAGEAAPVERELLDAVHPGRFVIRRLKKREEPGSAGI